MPSADFAKDDDQPIPLCVDLDGSLIRSDTLHEMVILLAKRSPASLARLPQWLAQGRSVLKHMVAEHVNAAPGLLPYRAEVLELISDARAAGRPIILATAAPARVAAAIAEHLGIFDEVLSSDRVNNLSGRGKAAILVARFGEGGYDYIGNDRVDMPVLAQARRGYLISSAARLRRQAARGDAISFIDDKAAGISVWVKALRVHQWLKNLLIFVPVAAAHDIGRAPLLIAAIIAFASFSLCASSVYILNDLLDLEADRAHSHKRNRPFASGAIPIARGVMVAPLLLAAAVALALLLPGKFLVLLLLYWTLTTSYSLVLKRQVIVDVMLLAGLYTFRILAGCAATGIAPSFWLLAFSMFVFLCLAMVKRYSELRLASQSGKQLAGRGYSVDDLPVILSLGTGSGMVSVLILAMYTQAEIVPVMYVSPEWLWLPPPLMLYWITRIWLKAQRGEVDTDPVVFAARDRQSLIIGTLMVAAFLLSGSHMRFW